MLPIFLLGAIAAAKSTVAIAVIVSAGATGIVGAVALGVIATPLLVTLLVFVLFKIWVHHGLFFVYLRPFRIAI